MSFRLPQRLSTPGLPDNGFDVLEYEMLAEKASSLGRTEQRMQEALKALRENTRDSRQAKLLKDAAAAVYAYFIQRELCGMRRHDDVIRECDIPRQVLARLGAR